MRASLDLDRFGISSAPRKDAMALERIVSKKLTSRYESGACNRWLKVKNPTYEAALIVIQSPSFRCRIAHQIALTAS
jgi:hypothetical protein